MLIDLGVACAWIAMSAAGAFGLGSLRRFGASAALAAEAEESSVVELYCLDLPATLGARR